MAEVPEIRKTPGVKRWILLKYLMSGEEKYKGTLALYDEAAQLAEEHTSDPIALKALTIDYFIFNLRREHGRYCTPYKVEITASALQKVICAIKHAKRFGVSRD